MDNNITMEEASPLRTVARLLMKGHIEPDGSVRDPKALTIAQLRDYVRALHAWNPDVVEESDFEGRGRADLARFVASYSADSRLVNRARGMAKKAPGATEARLHAQLMGGRSRPALDPPAPASQSVEPAPAPAPAPVDPEKVALLESLRGDHRKAMEGHRAIRKREDDIRSKIFDAVAVDARTRKLEQRLADVERQVAELTDALVAGSPGAGEPGDEEDEEDEEDEDALARIAGCEACVTAMLAEHRELCALREDCPDADVVVGLLGDVRALEEEQDAVARRASRAKAEADALLRALST